MTTVAETLDAFLSERTYRRCDDDPDAFANLFGPDKIPGQLGEFLGWYMVRKVMAGQELLKAAGTVTKKLSAWLEANGHISETDAAVMADRAADAVVELPPRRQARRSPPRPDPPPAPLRSRRHSRRALARGHVRH